MRVEELKKLVAFARRIIVVLIITNVITGAAFIGLLISNHKMQENKLMNQIMVEEGIPDESPAMELPPLEIIEENIK